MSMITLSPRRQRRAQDMLHRGAKHLGVGRTVNRHHGVDPVPTGPPAWSRWPRSFVVPRRPPARLAGLVHRSGHRQVDPRCINALQRGRYRVAPSAPDRPLVPAGRAVYRAPTHGATFVCVVSPSAGGRDPSWAHSPCMPVSATRGGRPPAWGFGAMLPVVRC